MKRAYILLAAVALLAALPLAGCSRASKGSAGGGAAQPATTIMVAQQINPAVVPQFKVGEEVRNKDSGVVIGTIESVTASPTVQAVPTAAGNLKSAASPIYVDVRLKIAGDAAFTDKGILFGGTYVYANEIDRFLTRSVQFDGLVVIVQPGASK